MSKTPLLLPVGLMIQGDAYKAREKDSAGNPLVVKKGPNAGKPKIEFFVGIAIPKEPGHTHWSQTAWGQQVLAVGAAAFPNLYQTPSFAWKIDDGDSTVPNKRGKKWSDNQHARGCWIVKCGGQYAPRVFQRAADGRPQEIEQPGFIKPGHYVQAQITMSGNAQTDSPGIYINNGMLLHCGYGPEIAFGPDAAEVFGTVATALPAGASAMPAGITSMAQLPAAAPTLPAAAPTLPAAAAPAPVVVQPAGAAFLSPGVAPAVPVAPAVQVPVVPAGPQMTAKAGGVPYAEFLKQGWTDQTLVQHGYMTA